MDSRNFRFSSPRGVYFRSSCIFEVPPRVGTWAGGGEGGGTGVGSGWTQLLILLLRRGEYSRRSRIFEVPLGVGTWAGGGEGGGTAVGSRWPQLLIVAVPGRSILSELSHF